ncbi:hypothetical protein [Chloroflexus sp.]|uniref:hypothetical protein n=1 Tax=Chloroflexus sp. TaxID=1904827 RepID=UPI003D14891B
MEQAIAIEHRDYDYTSWYPLSNPLAKQKLEEVLVILNQTDFSYPDFLRAKAFVEALGGDIESSISTLSAATAISPDSLLLWNELGVAYYTLDTSSAKSTMQIVAPTLTKDSTVRWLLPEKIPSLSHWWYPSLLGNYPAYLDKKVTFHLEVPLSHQWLTFKTVTLSDSIIVNVYVNNELIASKPLEETMVWINHVVDLSQWLGQSIQVTVELSVKGNDNNVALSELKLTNGHPCTILNCHAIALAAWKKARLSSKDFTTVLETVEHEQNYEVASSVKALIEYQMKQHIDQDTRLDWQIIESFASDYGIQICPWCGLDMNNAYFRTSNGMLELGNHTAVVLGGLNINTSESKHLVIRLRSKHSVGTGLVTAEVYLDGKPFERYFLDTSSEWQYWHIPVDGARLHMMLIAVRFDQNSELEIDWIALSKN